MQAALMYGPNDIRVEEIEKPKCPEGGFVLKVMAVGLCGWLPARLGKTGEWDVEK